MKGTTQWLSALAVVAALFGNMAHAETYSVGGKKALLVKIADFSASDLVISFSAKSSSLASRLFYSLYPGDDEVVGGSLKGSGSVNRTITTNANSLMLSITADDAYAISGIGIKGVDASKVTILGEVDKSSNVSVIGNVTAVPEVETYVLMGLGLMGLLLVHRRKSRENNIGHDLITV